MKLEELDKCPIVVAVVGQPNVGKSTLFNRLTGATARIGNFPGTTVEIKIGDTEYRGYRICFVDLPGIYGLSASTLEERIARRYVIEGRADVFLVLVDSTLPERTMYLALQMLELIPNVVVALTKWDICHKQGVHIHVDRISSRLGVPVVPISAVTGEGIPQLLEIIVDVATKRRHVRREPIRIDYGFLETYIEEIERVLTTVEEFRNYPKRWLAIRLLEGDEEFLEILRNIGRHDVIEAVERARNEIKRLTARNPEDLIIDTRFRYSEAILKDAIVRVEVRATTALRRPLIDLLFEHPIAGGLLSMVMLFLVFFLAFAINTGFPLNILFEILGLQSFAEALESYSLSGLIGQALDLLSEYVKSFIQKFNPVLASLIADGIISGVGAVLSFFPLILIIALLMAALEDSGLGPRMAVALHNFFTHFGLSGRAVYPLFIAFGCNVPAVLASRTAIDDVERSEIVMSVSFIPCQARLIVLLYFIYQMIHNPLAQGLTLFSIYIGGVVLYLLSSRLIRILIFRIREPPELLLEIPPIHRPSLRVVLWNSWDVVKHFLKKAGVIIFLLSIVTWYLLSYGPQGPATTPSESYGAIIGGALAPILKLMYGLNDDQAWKIGFALVNGFIAKEGLITTIAELSGVSEESAFEVLELSIPQGIAILIVMMYYVPCLATIAVIYQELKSVKMTLLTIGYIVSVAVLLSLLVYGVLVLVGSF